MRKGSGALEDAEVGNFFWPLLVGVRGEERGEMGWPMWPAQQSGSGVQR